MSIIDNKFLSLLSVQLRNFKRKTDVLWNFSCPLCGDSHKIKTKARGYVYNRQNKFYYKCHNCNVSCHFSQLLKQVSPPLYNDYQFEYYKNRANAFEQPTLIKQPELKITPLKIVKTEDIKLESIAELEDGHFAKDYIIKRKIPEHFHHKLYYTDCFASWVVDTFNNEKYKSLRQNDARIIIPFFDQEGNLIGAQGRSLVPDKKVIRYITVKVDPDTPLVYGLERWKPNLKTYVVEGPIDSLFLPNCLALAGSDLSSLSVKYNIIVANTVYVYDNEPRNQQIMDLLEETIESGANVCIWPNNIQQKDLNDMVLAGLKHKEIIDQNTYSGLAAKLKLTQYRRC